MQLSHERTRTRWLILVAAWALMAFVLFFHAHVVRESLDMIGQLGLRGAPTPATPLKAAYPALGSDAQTWVQHALTLIEGDAVRLRFTTIDNAPSGREVHWNSAWAWTIAGAGWLRHSLTGEPLITAVEKAAVWLNASVLFVLVVMISAWAARRAGAIAGVVVVAAMVCHDRFYEGFHPRYVDHHGLLTVAAFAMMLGAVFMGGGWWQEKNKLGPPMLPITPQAARRAAVVSALSGACGLWISAASIIPPIAIVGLSGILTILVAGRAAQRSGAKFDPGVWRIWGRVGAAASAFFYLLEYFPGHLGMRLEPNHPLHALAWLGGGEFVAQIGARWLGLPQDRWKNQRQLIWPVLAIGAMPLAIAIGGMKVFAVFDPFLIRLHQDYIQEFLPLWKTLQGLNGKAAFQVLGLDTALLLIALATLSYRGKKNLIAPWFATFAFVLFTAMAWWQTRWMLNAGGAQVCLALVLVAFVSSRPLGRWLAALTLIGVFFIPHGVTRLIGAAEDLKARRVTPEDAYFAVYRDIAATLRISQPQGDIVLLASPDGSSAIGYYGRFKTLGTLYWENTDGLKAAAAIIAARDEAEAAVLIRARRVTHIALVSKNNFVAEYFRLHRPQARAEEANACFGHQLLTGQVAPPWLQRIPYRLPDDLHSLEPKVMLFKVAF